MLSNIFLVSLICLCIQQIVSVTFEEECLTVHNIYRRRHGVPDLVLSKNLTRFSQSFAREMAQNQQMAHSKGNDYGENICKISGVDQEKRRAQLATEAWYKEVDKYNFAKQGFARETGHFTQVVWKSSRNLGCAEAENEETFYIVAHYDPPGNWQGRYPANVFPKKK